jgi:hypothetical protein
MRSIDLHQLILTKRIGMGRTLAVLIAIGLALTIISSGEVAAVVRGSIIAYFDQRIALDGEHVLVIHNGTSPTCAVIPNPPQHDCFRPDPERREFSVDYLTPNGVRSLFWFRLPDP